MLTPEGDYLKALRPGGDIRPGKEVECILAESKNKRKVPYSFIAAAAAVIILFIIPCSMFFLQGQKELVQGYLYIDINPSVELAYNKEFNVTGVRPLNSEGEKVLEGIVLGESIFASLDYLIMRSKELSYLEAEENLIMLTLTGAGVPGLEKEKIVERVKDILKDTDVEGFICFSEPAKGEEQRTKALEEGLSLNKYLVREEIRGETGNPDYQLPQVPLLDVVKEKSAKINQRLIPIQAAGKNDKNKPGEAEKDIPEEEGKKPEGESKAPENPGQSNSQKPQIQPPGAVKDEAREDIDIPDGRDREQGEFRPPYRRGIMGKGKEGFFKIPEKTLNNIQATTQKEDAFRKD